MLKAQSFNTVDDVLHFFIYNKIQFHAQIDKGIEYYIQKHLTHGYAPPQPHSKYLTELLLVLAECQNDYEFFDYILGMIEGEAQHEIPFLTVKGHFRFMQQLCLALVIIRGKKDRNDVVAMTIQLIAEISGGFSISALLEMMRLSKLFFSTDVTPIPFDAIMKRLLANNVTLVQDYDPAESARLKANTGKTYWRLLHHDETYKSLIEGFKTPRLLEPIARKRRTPDTSDRMVITKNDPADKFLKENYTLDEFYVDIDKMIQDGTTAFTFWNFFRKSILRLLVRERTTKAFLTPQSDTVDLNPFLEKFVLPFLKAAGSELESEQTYLFKLLRMIVRTCGRGSSFINLSQLQPFLNVVELKFIGDMIQSLRWGCRVMDNFEGQDFSIRKQMVVIRKEIGYEKGDRKYDIENFEEDSDDFQTIKVSPKNIDNVKGIPIDQTCQSNNREVTKQREWIQQHCASCRDIITLEEFQDHDFKDLISVRFYDDSTKKFRKGECMFLSDFQESLKSDLSAEVPETIYAIYKKEPGATDTIAGKGSSSDFKQLVFRINLSNGASAFIDFGSAVKILASPSKVFHAVPLYGGKRRRIGNVAGIFFFVGGNHAQVPGYRIHRLFSDDELMSNTSLESVPGRIGKLGTTVINSLQNHSPALNIFIIQELIVTLLKMNKGSVSENTVDENKRVLFSDIKNDVIHGNITNLLKRFDILKNNGSPVYTDTSFLVYMLFTSNPSVHAAILDYGIRNDFTRYLDQEHYLLTRSDIQEIVRKHTASNLGDHIRRNDVAATIASIQYREEQGTPLYDDKELLFEYLLSTENTEIMYELMDHVRRYYNAETLYNEFLKDAPQKVVKMFILHEIGDKYSKLVDPIMSDDPEGTKVILQDLMSQERMGMEESMVLDFLVKLAKHKSVRKAILDFVKIKHWLEEFEEEHLSDDTRSIIEQYQSGQLGGFGNNRPDTFDTDTFDTDTFDTDTFDTDEDSETTS